MAIQLDAMGISPRIRDDESEVTIWLFNIAMENPNHKWRFIAGKIIYKWAIFHGELLNNQRVIPIEMEGSPVLGQTLWRLVATLVDFIVAKRWKPTT